jgi:hypothetical protein
VVQHRVRRVERGDRSDVGGADRSTGLVATPDPPARNPLLVAEPSLGPAGQRRGPFGRRCVGGDAPLDEPPRHRAVDLAEHVHEVPTLVIPCLDLESETGQLLDVPFDTVVQAAMLPVAYTSRRSGKPPALPSARSSTGAAGDGP